MIRRRSSSRFSTISGVHIAHEANDLVDVVVEERTLDADEVRLHDGAAEQTTQHVAATFVGGRMPSAIMNVTAAVIGNDAQRQIGVGVLAVGYARKASHQPRPRLRSTSVS